MPRYEIEYDGKRFEVEAPDQQSAVEALQGMTGTAAAPEPPKGQEGPSVLGFLNQGIASALGAPVDAMAHVVNNAFGDVAEAAGQDYEPIEPFGGASSISKLMSGLGVEVADPDEAPDELMEHIFSGAGGAAGGIVPFFGAGRLLQGAKGLAGAAGDAIMRPFVNAPARALTSEVAAGAGAGAGVDVAERVAPDSALAPLVGALAGGTAAGVGPYAVGKAMPGTKVAGRMIQSEIAPFTEAGAMERARNRVRGLAEDPASAIDSLNAPTIGELSPATSTGDRRLMALEQSVRDTDPVADRAMRQAEAESDEALMAALAEPAQGVEPELARDFLEQELRRDIEGVGQMLDDSFGEPAGVRRTETALREGSAPARHEAYEKAYSQPIDYASEAGRNLESLIARVEKAAPGTISLANRLMAGEGVNSKQILASIGDDGSVTFRQLPDTRQIDYITRALNQMASSGDGAGALGGQTDVGRVMGNLARDIRNTLRTANPAYGDALATAATPIRQREALLLGQDLLNQKMPRDVVADQIAGMTEAELQHVRQGVRSHLDETLANARSTVTSPDAQANEARRALANLSSRAVRDKIALILPDEEARTFFEKIDGAAATFDPKRSGLAVYAGAKPDEEIRALLKTADPESAVAELVTRAKSDPNGKALPGLKGAFISELMGKAATGSFNDAGKPVLSGRAMQNALADKRTGAVASGLLSPDERARLDTIVEELGRMETAQGRLPSVGSVMEGEPNSIISFIARSFAARQGAKAGRGTSGASLLTANFASKRMQRLLERLTLDKAEALIRQAVTGDKELFEALLTPSGEISRRQERRLVDVLTGAAIGGVSGANAVAGEDDELIEKIMAD
ncbi:hypothetical protein JYP52_23035 [Nitratireductor aquibiodomus]|uniref:hypothetical protein n=1 Tax=Nitratireductor aquibiodomus TaxID=204799 RepID=UPI0019D34B13|nr:hypothetical protein [Nitratireductor aquibiodomus]MBN7764016.1 hypothetical protein [Nitratireductor aquibiodomus]